MCGNSRIKLLESWWLSIMLFISRVVYVLLCWMLVRRYGEDFGLIACYLILRLLARHWFRLWRCLCWVSIYVALVCRFFGRCFWGRGWTFWGTFLPLLLLGVRVNILLIVGFLLGFWRSYGYVFGAHWVSGPNRGNLLLSLTAFLLWLQVRLLRRRLRKLLRKLLLLICQAASLGI